MHLLNDRGRCFRACPYGADGVAREGPNPPAAARPALESGPAPAIPDSLSMAGRADDDPEIAAGSNEVCGRGNGLVLLSFDECVNSALACYLI